MGHPHHKPNRRCRRPRPRLCLRKGCGRKYQPRRPNQRYCQDPECLRLVRRWQAARRQARRRQDDAAKIQHAQAQRGAGSVPYRRRKHHKILKLRLRVVTQQEFFCRLAAATDRVAMNRPPRSATARRATVAPPVGRRCAAYAIASANGGSAALTTAGGRASRSTRLPVRRRGRHHDPPGTPAPQARPS